MIYDNGKISLDLDPILAFIEEEKERILEVVNRVAHEEAKKWEHEQTWKQPYAGNRLKGIAWEVRQALLSPNQHE